MTGPTFSDKLRNQITEVLDRHYTAGLPSYPHGLARDLVSTTLSAIRFDLSQHPSPELLKAASDALARMAARPPETAEQWAERLAPQIVESATIEDRETKRIAACEAALLPFAKVRGIALSVSDKPGCQFAVHYSGDQLSFAAFEAARVALNMPQEGDRSTWTDEASGESGACEFKNGDWRERAAHPPLHGVPVEDSPLWTNEQRRLAKSNHMDAYGAVLGWKD